MEAERDGRDILNASTVCSIKTLVKESHPHSACFHGGSKFSKFDNKNLRSQPPNYRLKKINLECTLAYTLETYQVTAKAVCFAIRKRYKTKQYVPNFCRHHEE